MPLRLFKARDGQEWRVWSVTPAGSVTLGATFRDGWLCFERIDGSDRRRLPTGDAPEGWDSLSNTDLDDLRALAEPAQYSQSAREAMAADQRVGDATPDASSESSAANDTRA